MKSIILLSRIFNSIYYRLFKTHRLKRLLYFVSGGQHYKNKHYSKKLHNSLKDVNNRTDISDHLNLIFNTTINAEPRLIVELGTRGGDSTKSLLAAAAYCDSTVLSIDIEVCSNYVSSKYWYFIKDDDISFAKKGFLDWCKEKSMRPEADIVFIDTSHLYEHTKKEIESWSKFLSKEGFLIFHDTNMGKGAYARNDGSIGIGWDNKRGVIRAIEEFMGKSYDENTYFCDTSAGYNLIHFPNCNGLTIIKKRISR